MKYPSAYYLLLLYITVVCKPLIPLVQDIYEHTFNEVEHLACVHHQNGMNHVLYEVGKMEKEDKDATNNSSKPKSSDEIAFHFLVENKLAFTNIEQFVPQTYFDKQQSLPIIFTSIQLPPPKP